MFKLNEVKTFDEIEALKQLNEFRATRAKLINNAVVITSTNKKFNADEKAQSRMNNAINACTLAGYDDDYPLHWSLADTPSGVGTEITLAELKEAYVLAVQAMSAIWLR